MAKVACPKCRGAGHIDAFSRIDNGRCFACRGRCEIFVSVSDFIKNCSDVDTLRKVSWMFFVSDEAIANLPFEKLEKIREFAHSSMIGKYDFIYGLYLSRFKDAFQAKQDEMFEKIPKPF